jgi:hypothetical protein
MNVITCRSVLSQSKNWKDLHYNSVISKTECYKSTFYNWIVIAMRFTYCASNIFEVLKLRYISNSFASSLWRYARPLAAPKRNVIKAQQDGISVTYSFYNFVINKTECHKSSFYNWNVIAMRFTYSVKQCIWSFKVTIYHVCFVAVKICNTLGSTKSNLHSDAPRKWLKIRSSCSKKSW